MRPVLIWTIFTICLYALTIISAQSWIPLLILIPFFAGNVFFSGVMLLGWQNFLKSPFAPIYILCFSPPVSIWLMALANIGMSFIFVMNGAFWMAGLSFCYAATENFLYEKVIGEKKNLRFKLQD